MNRAFALLVAAEEYGQQSGLPSLPGTIQHMEEFRDWLVNVRGAAPDDIFVCASPPRSPDGWTATRDHVRLALTALVTRAQNQGGDTFLLFSGHGFRVKQQDAAEDVFVGADYVPGDGGKCFRLAEVLAYLADGMGPGTHFWFVDACRTIVDIQPGPLSPEVRRSNIGRPVPHRLFSAAPGAPAWTKSQFPTVLRSALRGEGPAKEWIEGRYWVTAPRLFRTVEAAVRPDGIEVDFEIGQPVGRIWMVDPDPPPVDVTVEVGAAKDGDKFRLVLAGDRPTERRNLIWPENRVQVPPGEYYVNLEFGDEFLDPVDPPPKTKIDLYQARTVRFDLEAPVPKSIVIGGGGVAALRVAPPPSVNLNFRVGDQIVTGAVPIPPGAPVLVECLDLDEVVGEAVVSLERASGGTISLRDVIPKSPVRDRLLAEIGREDGVDAALRLDDFMEEDGPDEGVADADPSILLTLMGTAAICDVEPYRSLVNPLETFDGLQSGECAVYVLVSGGRGTVELLGTKRPSALEAVTGMPELAHAALDVPAGRQSLRITLPGVTDTVVRTAALANRVTLVVLATGGGSTRLYQFALPVGHLKDQLYDDGRVPPEDYGLLRLARFGVRVQRRFADGVPVLGDAPPDEHRTLWRGVSTGHWPDPLTVLVAAYELLRRGAAATEEHRWEVERLVREIADESRYGVPADAAVLGSLLEGGQPAVDEVPLVIDGMLASAPSTTDVPSGMVLSYDGPWTRWRSWAPPPAT